MDGAKWLVRITVTSDYSLQLQKQLEFDLTLEFRDICWDSDLQAPRFEKVTYEWDIWQG